MPNPIKYNSSTEDNALNIGNFWIGTGDVDKGPTSTTGYYNGITPPPNGYAIYVHKLNQGPSIRIASDDSELIEITNDIARASYTTITQCFNYFVGQSDKMVTHQTMNFRITDGLILDLDGNNIPSYPHNGTTWHDLSREGNNGTLINGPVFDLGGYITFDGTDDSVVIPNSTTNYINDDFTFSILVKSSTWTSGNQEGLVQKGSISNYGAYLRGGGGTVSFYTSPNSYWAPGPDIGGDGRWHLLTFVYSYSQLGYKQVYVDGLYHSQLAVTVPITSNTSDIEIGFAGVGAPKYLNGDVANYKFYKKVLTSPEILQNYYQAPIVTDGLIRALDFSNLVSYEIGNSGGFDLTGNDTFDLFNTPTPVSDYGGGISCNNTDEFIALADKAATDYVSAECWFRRDNADSGENIIFNKENSWEVKEQGGTLYWALKANNRSWFWDNSNATIDVDEICHIVLTYDGNTVKFFKNGTQTDTYTNPSGGVLSSQTNCYPKLNSRDCTRTSPRSLGNMTYFQFRIYDRALSSDEVSKNYHATKYKFDHT